MLGQLLADSKESSANEVTFTIRSTMLLLIFI